MPNELTVVDDAVEQVLIEGDLSKLNTKQRTDYLGAVCRSLGLNPLTQPFEYIRLNGKLKLYAKRDCTEQLRRIHGVSIEDMQHALEGEVYCVRVKARDKHGRTDGSLGAVPITGLKGEALANAYMKAETKAKRRVTLSICGLGLLDESEVESIPNAEPVPVLEPPPFTQPLTITAVHAEVVADPPDAVLTTTEAPAPGNGNEPVAVAQPTRDTAFVVGGRHYQTAGLTSATFVTFQELAKKYNKQKKQEDAARNLLKETTGYETSLDLTEEQGAKMVALFKLAVGEK